MGGQRPLRERAHAWVHRWWAGQAGAAGTVLGAALWPFEQAYRGVTGARNRGYDRGWLASERAAIPVVSIGNLGVGGAGKTPFTAWAARRLVEWGRRPAVVLRGYGGDEVLLHRELNPEVPVFAAAKRAEGVREATAAGCDVAVLDDAFQHRALTRDLDVVLISAESWQESPRLLPRGPWRESEAALGRAGAVVVTRKSAGQDAAESVAAGLRARHPGLTVAVCWIAPSDLAPLHASAQPAAERALETLRGREVLAVAALADPAPFAANLRGAGVAVELLAFPDHHPYSPADAAAILRRAAGRPIVMTHKDAVKLRALLPTSADALVLRQRVVPESGMDAVEAALRRAVTGAGVRP
ncbi:MAG TPA: tetraacyldisaccharide 4'-kinase [Longimicrobiaceae bacterium]|nr:tetraacyldisaccharide 4'-kinase [Longimicrobiaceae bacterium]